MPTIANGKVYVGTQSSLTVFGLLPFTTPWTFCAVEDQFCAFSGTKLVRYGAGNTFTFQTATNGVSCSNAVFGDPLVGVVKHCDYTETTSSAAQ